MHRNFVIARRFPCRGRSICSASAPACVASHYLTGVRSSHSRGALSLQAVACLAELVGTARGTIPCLFGFTPPPRLAVVSVPSQPVARGFVWARGRLAHGGPSTATQVSRPLGAWRPPSRFSDSAAIRACSLPLLPCPVAMQARLGTLFSASPVRTSVEGVSSGDFYTSVDFWPQSFFFSVSALVVSVPEIQIWRSTQVNL